MHSVSAQLVLAMNAQTQDSRLCSGVAQDKYVLKEEKGPGSYPDSKARAPRWRGGVGRH